MLPALPWLSVCVREFRQEEITHPGAVHAEHEHAARRTPHASRRTPHAVNPSLSEQADGRCHKMFREKINT